MVNGKNGWMMRLAAMLIASAVIAVVAVAFGAKDAIQSHKAESVPHPVLSIQIEQIAKDVQWIREHLEN